MPAWEKDIEEAMEEGVVINSSWSPKRIYCRRRQRSRGMKFTRCMSVFDEDGRFNPACDDE